MAGYFIGLDCGGTKSRGVLADKEMRIFARAKGGPGNPVSAGMTAASRSYRSLIQQLLEKARLKRADVVGLGAGVAGGGRSRERDWIEAKFRQIVPNASVSVDTDGMIALLGATLGEPGIIVISGTGSFVLGMDHSGRRFRGGGWGPLLGDEGSGATLGRESVQAILRAEDGREPATGLRKEILIHFKARTPDALVSSIYRRPPTARQFAQLWPILCRVAERGDRLASAILEKGGRELAQTVDAVIRQLNFKTGEIPLILTGGVLSQESLLRRTVLVESRKLQPNVHSRDPAASPEIGALYLAGPRYKFTAETQ